MASEIAAAPDPTELQRKLVILVVEDEVVLRTVIADHLHSAGFAVVEATNARDAIEVIASQVRVDLVFTDINMPGEMDGQSLAGWLLVHRPGLPVILTSGGAKATVPAYRHNRRFMGKPYLLAEVERQIRILLERPAS
jgi:CheY-like chemotaxis protein